MAKTFGELKIGKPNTLQSKYHVRIDRAGEKFRERFWITGLENFAKLGDIFFLLEGRPVL